jgi:hypothetical protein
VTTGRDQSFIERISLHGPLDEPEFAQLIESLIQPGLACSASGKEELDALFEGVRCLSDPVYDLCNLTDSWITSISMVLP